ncbi:MAG: AraC family transcriptional regulator, partial [bacterium]|nr:AraC family transcriptional regulator [bacterium]
FVAVYRFYQKRSVQASNGKKSGQSEWKNHFRENQVLWLMPIIYTVMITASILTRFLFSEKTADIAIISYMTLVFYIVTFWLLKGSRHLKTVELPEEETKYKKSALDNLLKEEILKKILAVMDQKPYLESIFTLSKLSKMVGAKPHHVSQVLNECKKTTFLNMVGQYRIDEARRLLTEPGESERTILDIAEAVGYSSKSAFNAAFKKITGVPPSAYRKKMAD